MNCTKPQAADASGRSRLATGAAPGGRVVGSPVCCAPGAGLPPLGQPASSGPYPDEVNPGPTSIRLIEDADADALAAHLSRDEEVFERWEPFRPAGFFTPAGQHQRIERLRSQHAQGGIWPAVILSGPELVGQITVQNIEYVPVRGA